MSLRLHDTASGKRRPLRLVEPGVVRLYTCGPTLYADPHVGNFRTFLLNDLLHRHLEASGLRVHHVMNLTDVEDKIIRSADLAGVSIEEFTARYEANLFEDLARLRIRPATEYPRATAHIPEMIELIQRLLERGRAYVVDDGVYFRIASFPDYGRLVHLDREQLRTGARVASDEYEKETATDFALWKAVAPVDEKVGAVWESPFGRGRPGWHIECSAMSMRYLGETLDLHTGGVDLRFPHHTNEIAQSEGATGHPFCRHWVHGEFLTASGGDKMSKSLGNIATARDLLASGYEPAAVRFFLLASAHYASPLALTSDGLHGAVEQVRRLRDLAHRLRQVSAVDVDDRRLVDRAAVARSAYQEALDDDLNLARGVGVVMELVREANAALDAGAVGDLGRRELLAALTDVDTHLDILAEAPEQLDAGVERQIALREEARGRRDFAAADLIREELRRSGVLLEDTPSGVRWRRLA